MGEEKLEDFVPSRFWFVKAVLNSETYGMNLLLRNSASLVLTVLSIRLPGAGTGSNIPAANLDAIQPRLHTQSIWSQRPSTRLMPHSKAQS